MYAITGTLPLPTTTNLFAIVLNDELLGFRWTKLASWNMESLVEKLLSVCSLTKALDELGPTGVCLVAYIRESCYDPNCINYLFIWTPVTIIILFT